MGDVNRALCGAIAAAAFLLVHAAAAATVRPFSGEPRVLRGAPNAPRFVRLAAEIAGAGVRGTAVLDVDRATGRTAERVRAGPLSSADGFDGSRVWHADATGLAMIVGNADARRDGFAWAHLFGRAGPERPAIATVRARDGAKIVRVRYAGLSGTLTVTTDARGRVVDVLDATGVDPVRTSFAAYRRVRGVDVPFAIVQRSPFATWRYRATGVAFPATIDARAFAPPPPPRDAMLHGVTTLPMHLESGAPVVDVRVDGHPMRVLFDSGATNYLTPAAARRAGLRGVGEDKSGGVGPTLVRERYATAHRLDVGDAVVRDAPFGIVDDAPGSGIDGAIGQEVLQRFAVAFDFPHRRVRLARTAAELGATTGALPLRLGPSGPETDGTLDGLRGAVAIDTGSGMTLDVMSPFVRKHALVRRYRAGRRVVTGSGIGGATTGFYAIARSLRIGSVAAAHVPIVLNAMTTGAFADPTQLGNLGTPLLLGTVTIFDERNGRLWLLRP